MKKFISIIRASSYIVAISIFLYLSPLISVYLFAKSIENNDHNKINEYIDYPSLRNSLSPQFSFLLGKYLSRNYPQISNNLASGILVKPLSRKLIDSALNPESVRSLLSLKKKLSKKSTVNSSKISSNHLSEKIALPKINFNYNNPNSFVISSYFSDNSYRIVTTWDRFNIINWKLIAIELPVNDISLSEILESIKLKTRFNF